jgi:hypothetical protein
MGLQNLEIIGPKVDDALNVLEREMNDDVSVSRTEIRDTDELTVRDEIREKRDCNNFHNLLMFLYFFQTISSKAPRFRFNFLVWLLGAEELQLSVGNFRVK